MNSRIWPALLLLFSPTAAAQLPLETWEGPTGEFFGWSAAFAGDVNADGVDDVLVGSPELRNPSTSLYPIATNTGGVVRVFSGSDGALLHELRDGRAESRFGRALAGLGDIDGDGHADFAISAPTWASHDVPHGELRAVSGLDGSTLWSVSGPPNKRFGWLMAATGDLDGDGAADLLLTVQRAGSPFRVDALSGRTGASLWSSAELSAAWPALDAMGDVDGDGLDDLVMGAHYEGSPQQGAVRVLSGADGGVLLELVGESWESLGRTVAGLGDVDGDGVPDLAAALHPTGAGGARVRAYSGASGAQLLEFTPESDASPFPPILLAGTEDHDGDGVPELYCGTYRAATLRSGADGQRLARYFLQNGGGLESIAVGGDLDGDGRGDLLLGGGGVVAFPGALPVEVVRGCFGDGTGAPCPCGNPGHLGAGCMQSPGAQTHRGAQLFAQGSVSVGADDLSFQLVWQWTWETPVILVAGTDHGPPVPFGDGLSCLRGELSRVAIRTKPTVVEFGPGLAAREGYAPGDLRAFQVWYRSALGPCQSGFNLSNNVVVTFAP